MTPDEKLNEHNKLIANWLNTLATAIMAAGTFVPVAQFVYGFLPHSTGNLAVYAGGSICVIVGLLLHFAAHGFLRRLR